MNTSNITNTTNNVKIMTSEYEDIRKTSLNLDFKNDNLNNNNISCNLNNGILILNNPNFKNSLGGAGNRLNNNFNFSKYDQSMLRKRNRLSSFEGFWNNIDFENLGYNHKKSIDEVEFLNSFGKEIKYDFHEEELEIFDKCLKNTAAAATGFAFGIETKTRDPFNKRRTSRNKSSVSFLLVLLFNSRGFLSQ